MYWSSDRHGPQTWRRNVGEVMFMVVLKVANREIVGPLAFEDPSKSSVKRWL
jgi:hypothetical protein